MTDVSNIWQFDLRRGNSDDPRNGACLLDAVSWFEYGKLGDHPACVCPIIATFARTINDILPDADRQRLKIFIPRLIGTVDPSTELARGEYLAWQAIKVFAPMALDAAGFAKRAEKLRNFKGSLKAAAKAAKAVHAATDAAALAYAAYAAANYAHAHAHDAAYAVAHAYAAADAHSHAQVAASHAAAAAKAATDAAAHAPLIIQVCIDTLDNVLKIGKKAAFMPIARIEKANANFACARDDRIPSSPKLYTATKAI